MKYDIKTVAVILVLGYLGAKLGERFLPATIQSMVEGA